MQRVKNVLLSGATNPVAGLPNRMDLFASLEFRNRAPVGMMLSNAQIDENTDTTGGLTVGELLPDDSNVCDRHRFEVTGGADAASFTVVNSDQLRIDDGVLDFETQSIYQIEVTATDFFGLSVTRDLTISVNDLPEIP